MYILMVRLKAKQDHINDFIKASIADGTGSVLHEPGCRRFDIIQDETDPTPGGEPVARGRTIEGRTHGVCDDT